MKFSIKKITFLVLMSMMSLATFAQVEVKINPIGAIFSSPDVSVEYIATDNFGIEGRVGYSWSNASINDLDYSNRGLVFIGGARYYFNPNNGGDKFYLGAYTKFKNSTFSNDPFTGEDTSVKYRRLAAGALIGYKVMAGNEKITFDINFGLGKALSNTYSDNASDNFQSVIPITSLDVISTLAVGYRF